MVHSRSLVHHPYVLLILANLPGRWEPRLRRRGARRARRGLLEEFDRTRERVLAASERAVEQAKRTLALKYRDPTNALSARDLKEANAKKREFVKEDCETMPIPDVTDRARVALG
jgi:hypothetical protein